MDLALRRPGFYLASLALAAKTVSSGLRRTRGALAVAAGLMALVAPRALESAAANGDTRTLYLYHSHSKEAIAATFRVNGHYDSAVLEKLNWFLRDWRNDEPTKMDPRLFDAVWEAYRSAGRNTGDDDPIVVVSAYRCPATNAMLRRRSRSVAEHSQHMLGKAMDSTMPGLSMEKLREIAMRMQRGGVGYYPRANTPFVHIDVGGVRHWPRMTYDQLSRLFPDGKTVHIPSNGKPLDGYELAKAEIEARGGETISLAEARSDGIGGFFASLFGGGHSSEEDEARDVAPMQSGRVAARAAAVAEADAKAKAQRKLVANAETDLPRGETYLAPPQASVTPPPPPPAPEAPKPAAQAKPLKPTPLDEPAQEQAAEALPQTSAPEAIAALADAPLPPRRPVELAAAEVPLPPARPAELARLAASPASPPGAGAMTLAYAAPLAPPRSVAAPAPPAETTPLPPPRPVFAPLRAAAASKAEQARAEKAAATQMAPARVGRDAIAAAAQPPAAGFAPPLRAAARPDVFAASAPPKSLNSGFGATATTLSADAFTR